MKTNIQTLVSKGKSCLWKAVVLIFIMGLAGATKAQTSDLGLGLNDANASYRSASVITNTFDWSSVASTEERMARYDLSITKPSANSHFLGKLLGEFRSIQLQAFQKPNGEPMVVSGVALEMRQSDYSDLLGFRLGPWFESSLTERILLHASGGLALGMLDAGTGWNGTSLLAETSLAGSSSRTYFKVASGLYAGVDAIYRLGTRWGVGVGAQIQNLIFSDRYVSERPSSVNWSKCIMVEAGFNYSF